MLSAAGHTEWIAEDARAYERLAVEMAENIDAVRANRAALRRDLEASALMDEKAYLKAFSAEIERMWEKYGDFKR